MKKFKSKIKAALAVTLSAAMVLSVSGQVSFAEEPADYYDYTEDYDSSSLAGDYSSGGATSYWGDDDDESSSGTDTGYSDLQADNYDVSFGRVNYGSQNDYIRIRVKNAGTAGTGIVYYTTDANDVFYVDAPDSLYLGSGESTYFYVDFDTYAPQGSYYGTLCIMSSDDGNYDMIKINITGEIVDNSPVVRSVTVSPSSMSLSYGSGMYFTANVIGDNLTDRGVTWHVRGASDSGTNIDSNGYLTVSNNETSTSLQVVAVSKQDAGVEGRADITLTGGNYTVSTSSNPSNGGTTGGASTVSRGSSVTLLAAPNNGYEFVNWTQDGKVVSTSAKYVINSVKSNMSLVANFKPTSCYVKVTTNRDNAGKVTDSANVSYGGNITLTATPNSGFKFDGWYENDKLLSSSTSINLNNITSNREIKACFSQTIFNVTLKNYPEGCGVISGGGNYNKGSNVTITAKPIDGYNFVKWMTNNDVISTDASCTIKNIDRDYVITAVYEKKNVKTYSIAASVASGQGVITPGGITNVAEGNSIVYTFAPLSGYVISAVSVDGLQVGCVSSYSFSNVHGNHTIAVAFVKKSTSGSSNSSSQPSATAPPNNNPSINVVTNDSNNNPTDQTVTFDTDVDEAEELNDLNNVEPEAIDNPDWYDYTENTGILQQYNITEEEARSFIESGQGMLLLERAAEAQYLQVSVHNEYASDDMETQSTGYENLTSLPNFQNVVDAVFTTDEKIEILKGNTATVNVNIFNNDGLETTEDKQIDSVAKQNNVNIGSHFEIVMMKQMNGSSQMVTELATPMTMVINVPKELKSDGRTFCIVRAHQGSDGKLSISFLEDTDNCDDTITVSTDLFSSYAIGYVGGAKSSSINRNTLAAIAAAAIFVVAVVTSITIGVAIGGRRVKRRRHK